MMLEKLQNRFQYVLLAVLVVMVAGVFATQFGGQQAQGFTAGGATYAVSVDGDDVSDGDFRAVYRVGGFERYDVASQRAQNLRRLVANGIVERRLLAEEARRLGIVVTPEQAMEEVIRKDRIWISTSVEATGFVPNGGLPARFRDDEGNFQRDNFEAYIKNGLRRSIGEFAEWQAEELMAERMREILRASVQVSPGELWDQFSRERNRARIRYVRYSAAYYRDRIQPTDAELDAYITANAQEIDQAYQQNRFRYTGLELQVRARHILVKVDAGADEAAKQAARQRAQQLLARARAGEDFAALARQNSQDEGSARRGGDLGWNPRGRMVAPFDQAQFALQPGQISDVVESQFGFHVIKVEGRREGDVPEAEAKREIARDRYVDSKAGEQARQAAEQALAALRGGKTLDQLAAELSPPAPEGQPAPERDPNAPTVEESQEFGPSESPIQGASNSGAVAQAAFSMTMDQPLVSAPIALGNDYVVFRLESRTEASRADFDETTRERLREGLLARKRREAVVTYTLALRKKAEEDGRIRINPAVLSYGDEQTTEASEEDEASSEMSEMSSMSSMSSGMSD